MLFPKIVDRNDRSRLEIIERQKQHLAKVAAETAVTPSDTPVPPSQSPEINYEDFAKLDLRTGTILEAEPVAGADKLLKLLVDLGYEQRTVVSGIALHFKPEEVIGQKVVLVANLAPRKLRGIISQGMILMAEDASGRLSFISPPAHTGNGLVVK